MAAAHSEFLETTTMKEILGISEDVLDHAMAVGYQLYKTGRYCESETVCRGLLACDHQYWWTHSLLAAILRRQGRIAEAIEAVEQGLRYEPDQPKLLLMRAELTATLSHAREQATGGASITDARFSTVTTSPRSASHFSAVAR